MIKPKRGVNFQSSYATRPDRVARGLRVIDSATAVATPLYLTHNHLIHNHHTIINFFDINFF